MSHANQYTDTDQAFNTNAQIDDDIVSAYMDMQARVYADFENRGGFNHAMYSQTAQDMRDAYTAGYEQADRCQTMFGTMTFGKYTEIGIRHSTGIRFASGVAANAFKAGYQARQNA